MQSLTEPLVFSNHLRQFLSEVFESCYASQLLSFNLDLPLDAIGTVCQQFGLFSIVNYKKINKANMYKMLICPILLCHLVSVSFALYCFLV